MSELTKHASFTFRNATSDSEKYGNAGKAFARYMLEALRLEMSGTSIKTYLGAYASGVRFSPTHI